MSTILAIETQTHVVLAADQRYTLMSGVTASGSSKIFTISEDLYISYAGCALWDTWLLEMAEEAPNRLGDIPLPSTSPVELPLDEERDRRWLFANRPVPSEVEEVPIPTVIAATPRGIFLMDAMTTIKLGMNKYKGLPPIAVASEGSGGHLAQGALISMLVYAGEDQLKDAEFLQAAVFGAVKVASLFDPHTGGGVSIRILPKKIDHSNILVESGDDQIH